MCGIAALIGWDPEVAARAIVPMTRSLAHRGPDGERFWTAHGVAFGHRRLSIIDLSESGSQPMTAGDDRYSLIFNGELYNFPELRRELAKLGHQFVSRSDTEVVLHALIEWGAAAVPRLNGMFALVFYDTFRRQVLIARDRYGIKPLYLWEDGASLAVASESKAFMTLPGFRRQLDLGGLVEYMNFQNFFTDRTLLAGVTTFPAGHLARLQLTPDGQLARPARESIEQYWDFHFEEPEGATPSEGEYLEELDRLFRAAVERQLVADVPVNSYLSGGLDTGGITAIASRSMPLMRTFTVGFDMSSATGLEQGRDERQQAERISYLCGTQHYEMVLKAGDMERCMRELVTALEEPRVGQSYPNYYAAMLASKFGKVVLSGTGGDELFAGYPWRYFKPSAAAGFDEYATQYFEFWQRLVPKSVQDRPILAGGRHAHEEADPLSIFLSVFPHDAAQASTPIDFVNLSLYFEAKTFLHGLLVVEDKLSMAHSLESRVPILDNDLVDFAMRLPMRHKLTNLDPVRVDENLPGGTAAKYNSEHKEGKLILRNLLTRYVGDEQAGLRKQGFSGPDASWFRGESLDFVRRTLTPTSSLFDVLEASTFLPLVDEHLQGRANHRLLVWSLLSLQTWLDVFA